MSFNTNDLETYLFRNMKNNGLFFLILWTALCQAQHYEGSLGKNKIHLSLEIYDHEVDAYYFYDEHLKSISLEGNRKNDALVLYKRLSEPEERKELFSLDVNGGKLVGTWQNGIKTAKVQLTKTTKDFQDFKQKRLKFKRDSVEKYDAKEIVWLTEKYSKQSFFRLGNGFSKDQRDFLNPKLDFIQRDYAETSLDCDFAEIYTEIELISDEYLSFLEHISTYCGGVHPNTGYRGYTFDLEKNTEIDKISDLHPYLDWYELLKKKYQNDESLQPECDYFLDHKEVWKYVDWVFTEKGITIIPEFAHALAPCEIEFYLTYKELEEKEQ